MSARKVEQNPGIGDLSLLLTPATTHTMDERGKWKGTVTPLSAVMPAEEARKAAKKVEEAIADKEGHLNLLHRFVTDNNNTINLVKRLPDELHHDIMVPFGKAAFFPGRLVHTNEFRVLLGEGYYAERTSKQTVEILRRRGKTLDSQVDALKGMIDDLRLEATFFNSTAAESEEGLLEIREEPQSVRNILDDEDDHKARMDELKRNEEKYAHADDKDYAKMMARLDELEREEEEEAAAAAATVGIDVDDPDDEELAQRFSGLSDWMGSLGLQSSLKGQSPSKKDLLQSMKERSAKADSVTSQVNMGIPTAPKLISKTSLETSKPDIGPVISRPIKDSQMAFSGSIIERTDNLPTNPNATTHSQPSSSKSSKPVSRFKMQRR
ncbi:hypothetical protein V2J09_002627 [Rumex salicifolius]